MDGLFFEGEDGEPVEWMEILMDNSSNPETTLSPKSVQGNVERSTGRITRRSKTGIYPK